MPLISTFAQPLCDLLGKPMIQRVYERAVQARSLARVVVATDDERIAATCRKFGAEVVMTSVFCANGTERCAEAARREGVKGCEPNPTKEPNTWHSFDIFVRIVCNQLRKMIQTK